jgi:hypothetical protein
LLAADRSAGYVVHRVPFSLIARIPFIVDPITKCTHFALQAPNRIGERPSDVELPSVRIRTLTATEIGKQ